MPKVSILVPCYNVEKYLRQCLDSVVNQTLKDIEIICINDGSTDSTLEILREYENNDSRIKVISKRNSGYGASMNIGLETAKGEYIGIVESDDYVELNMFETLYNVAKENDCDLARCQYYMYNSKKDTHVLRDNSWVPQNKVYCPLDDTTPFFQSASIWANIFKKEMIMKNKIRFLETPGASYQDTSFTFKLYACAKRFIMIPNAFLHYRIDNENSSVNSKGKIYCIIDEYNEIEKFFKENNFYSKMRTIVSRIKYDGYKWNHERLAMGLKQQFLIRWSFEILKDFIKGNIDKKMYSKNEYKKLKKIAFTPYRYLLRKRL